MRHGLAALAIGALLATSVTGPATAAPPSEEPIGPSCGLTAVDDPTAEAGVRTGELHGGPLAGSGTLTCTVQVNAATHAGPDAASVSATWGTIVVIWPSAVSYTATRADTTYVCTAFTTARGARLYRTGGRWTADPNAACDIIGHEDEHAIRPLKELADPLVCPVVAAVPARPGLASVTRDGDVVVGGRTLWDCAPYAEDPALLSTAGGITITDIGNGPVYALTGDLATPLWACFDSATPYYVVICDYASWPLPGCDRVDATAVSLPPAWGSVDTWAICEGDQVAEFVSSGTATQTPAFRTNGRTMVPQQVTRVYCQAHDGAHNPAVGRYVADCQFTFV
jgi:hypothetical protein